MLHESRWNCVHTLFAGTVSVAWLVSVSGVANGSCKEEIVYQRTRVETVMRAQADNMGLTRIVHAQVLSPKR